MTEYVACKHCGDLTRMLGTRECDRCHELWLRIRSDPELARKALEEVTAGASDADLLELARRARKNASTDQRSEAEKIRDAAAWVCNPAGVGGTSGGEPLPSTPGENGFAPLPDEPYPAGVEVLDNEPK